ncbi:MAG: ABC transporter ATP-binding protein [Cyclobacteriaceae bacterium]|nr:ABC transporter ATP-binding protein [Cyclobacteriaceae bacterium]
MSTTNLVVGYRTDKKDHILFNNLSLKLRQGELVCFMGSNGVGKSTLIRTLAGLQEPLAGAFEIPNDQSVAVVLTDRINSALMTVYDLITYGRYPYLNWKVSLSKLDHELIDHAIQLVHLESIIAKKLFELSDGQLQMVMIAKALAQNTPILFLDEPTAHLDLNNRVEIMNILRSLCRTAGKSILVATHELDLALQTADSIWLATPDRKIIEGIPEDLVLDGTFDQVFQFKGFDLKTGKMTHETFRKTSIHLKGEGHTYLWTKNALERNGYEVNEKAPCLVSISEKNGQSIWSIENSTFKTIKDLLENLKKF